LRAPAKKPARRLTPPSLAVRLGSQVTLETQADGKIAACFGGYSVDLGKFGTGIVKRAQALRSGLPLAAFAAGGRTIDKETELLVRSLARRGLVEYRLRRSRGDADQVVIEPQAPDYWPQAPMLRDADTLALSRFAYLRRRGNDMVLESPRALALFKIRDPQIAALLATLAVPQPIKQLRRHRGFPGLELLALLVDSYILFKVDAAHDKGPRQTEGDDNLLLWDFHDLVFHARSTEGRHANPLGGVYPYADVVPPLPPVRPPWPGETIDLKKFLAAQPVSPTAKLLRERHSTRVFDEERPITLGELSQFLDGAARVLATLEIPADHDDGAPSDTYTVRPYPSAGASYALELYLAVDRCEGLARGFYHYDAGAHALVPIAAAGDALDMLLMGAAYAMGAPSAPQILITIAARFGRMSWKYSSIAYGLILKDVGVLTQTLYLMATDMQLGGCAVGISNIDLFAKMTGIDVHVEGPVGQFALGRAAAAQTSG